MTATDDAFVVDADSHWCERPDLFTSRAPARYRDRVPHVEDVDGAPMWVFDGQVEPKLATLRPEARTKILGENARKLYRL